MVALVSGAAGTVAATALTVQAAEAVDMSEVEPAGTVEEAGTGEAVEVEAVGTVGTVEVVEAFGRQPLCAVAGGVACYQVSAACFVVPAPFSVADLS